MMNRRLVTHLMTIGLNGQARILEELPIHVTHTATGAQAVRALRELEFLHGAVSRWDLPDMRDGELIRRIKRARPWLATVVLLDEPYGPREAAVRRYGVVAVLPGEPQADLLRDVVAQMLHLTPCLPCGAAFGSRAFEEDHEPQEQSSKEIQPCWEG